jgi:hypothetical protein
VAKGGVVRGLILLALAIGIFWTLIVLVLFVLGFAGIESTETGS